jgi:hypothetical protein
VFSKWPPAERKLVLRCRVLDGYSAGKDYCSLLRVGVGVDFDPLGVAAEWVRRLSLAGPYRACRKIENSFVAFRQPPERRILRAPVGRQCGRTGLRGRLSGMEFSAGKSRNRRCEDELCKASPVLAWLTGLTKDRSHNVRPKLFFDWAQNLHGCASFHAASAETIYAEWILVVGPLVVSTGSHGLEKRSSAARIHNKCQLGKRHAA